MSGYDSLDDEELLEMLKNSRDMEAKAKSKEEKDVATLCRCLQEGAIKVRQNKRRELGLPTGFDNMDLG